MNAGESFAVTGLGVVNAAGNNAKAYWECLARGQSTVREERLFGMDMAAQRVMRAETELMDHGYAARQVKRLDRCTLLASAAIREAVEDAHLEVRQDDEGERVGILVGNTTGGWSYVEPQLYPLYRDHNLAAVNPYVATAWFPTASQGEVSIATGMAGYSKTFCAENISAAFALRQACWLLSSGVLEVAIVCGAEAPLTPLVYNACVRTGLVSLDGAYHPYSYEADGAVLGEGAAAIVLESATHARARGVAGVARLTAPAIEPGWEPALRRALQAAGAHRVDYVALEGRAQVESDQQELCSVENALAGELPAMGTSTGTSGATLGASFATGVVATALALRHQAIPGGTRVHGATGGRVRVEHAEAQDRAVRVGLVVGSDGHGQVAAAVMTAAGAA